MSSVDKRIVEMQFNNKQFESGAKQTMQTLEQLDKNLHFDQSGIAKGVEFIADKFTIMGTAARRAIENITDSVMSVSKNLINDFFVAPKSTGFEEYELKMGSVQTIINSVKDSFDSEGEALDYVNEKLDALNKYADKTKYSFADATASIGKFTNAGVNLDLAVESIQGIMNLSAVSGQGAQQANSAMYNFAQALGTGFLGLVDWKSIENANLATVEFKNELIDTAVAMGTLVEENGKFISTTTNGQGKVSKAFDALDGFRDSLQHQWITADVLTQTLARYADETTDVGVKATEAATKIFKFSEMMDALKETAGSGWTSTWELVFGDYHEAAELWTGIYKHFNDILDKQAEARNAMLKDWKSYNGFKYIYSGLGNLWNAVEAIVSAIKEAWGEIFKPMSGWDFLKKSQQFNSVTITIFRTVKKATPTIKTFFTYLFSALKGALNIVKPLVATVKGVFSLLKPIASIIGTIFGKVGEILSGIFSVFSDGGKVDVVRSITEGITFAFEWMAERLQKAAEYIKNTFASTEEVQNKGIEIGTSIKNFFVGIKDAVANGFQSLGGFQGIKDQIVKIFSDLGAAIGGGFSGVIDWFKNLMTQMKEYNFGTFLDALNIGTLVTLMVQVHKAVKNLKDISEGIKTVTDGLADIFKGVSKVLNNAADVLKAYATSLKADAFLKIAIAVAVLVAALIALTLVDQDKLTSAAGVLVIIAGALTMLISATGKVQTIGKAFNTLANSFALMNVGGGLLLIAAGLAAILGVILLYNMVGWATLVKGIISLFAVLITIGGTLVTFATIAKTCSASLIAFSAAFAVISVGLAVLAGAISIFSAIPWESLGKAGATFGVFILGFVGSILLLSGIPTRQIQAIANGFIKLSVAFGILTISLGFLVPTLMAFTMLAKLGGWEGFGLMAATIGVLSGALIALAVAVKIMGDSAKYLGNIAIGLGLLTLSIVALALVAPIIIASAEQIKEALILLINIVCDTIIASAKPIIKAVFTLLDEAIKALKEYLPTMIDNILSVLVEILKAVDKYTPEIVTEVYRIISGIIDGLKKLVGNDMPDPEMIGAIIIGMMGMVTVIQMLAKAKTDIKNAIPTAIFMLTLMVGVAAVFKMMNDAGMATDNTINQAIAIGLVIGALGISIKAMTGIRGGMKGVVPTLATMFIMVGALYAIMDMFILMNDLDSTKMIKQAIALGLVLLALGHVMKQANGMPSVAKSKAILLSMTGFVLALGMIAGAFLLLKDYNTDGMIEKALAMSMILLAIGLAIKASSNVRGSVQNGASVLLRILAFTAALIPIAEALKDMSGIQDDDMLQKALALGLVLDALAIAVKITSGMTGTLESAVAVAVEVVAFMIALSELPKVFATLKENDIKGEEMISQAAALAIVLDSMSVAIALCNSMKTDIKEAGAVAIKLGALIASLYGITGVFYILKQNGIDGNDMIPQAEALGILIDLMSGAVLALSYVKAGGAVEGAAAFAAVTIVIATIAEVFALLQEITSALGGEGTDFKSTLGEGMDILVMLLTKVGEAIGGFVGGLIGGAMEGVISVLPNIADTLSDFINRIQPFLKGCEKIKPEAVEGAGKLAAVIIAFMAISVFEALTQFLSFITGSTPLTTVAKMLDEIAPHLKSFCESIAGVGPEAANSAANVANAIANLINALPHEGGLQSIVNGKLDLAGLFTPVEDGLNVFGLMGRGLKQFQKESEGIDEATVQNAVNCGKIIVTLAEALPKTGGITQMWEGEVGYTQFANGMAAVGRGIRLFKEEAGDITEDEVKSGVAAGKLMTELAKALPQEGGIWQAITGHTGYNEFVSGMRNVGVAINNFKTSAGSITPEDVQSGINAGDLLVNFANKLTGTGGVWNTFWNDWFGSGSFNYESFKTNITMMGEAIKSFSDSTVGVTSASVQNGKLAAETLVGLVNTLNGDENNKGKIAGFIDDLFGKGSFDYKTFKDNIVLLGSALSTFSSDTSGIDGNALDKSVSALNNLIEVTKNAKDVDTKSFDKFNQAMSNLASEGINNFIAKFDTSDNIINSGISKFMVKIQTALENYKYTAIDKAELVGAAIVGQINKLDTYTVGTDLMTNLASGIENSKEDPIGKKMSSVIVAIYNSLGSAKVKEDIKGYGSNLMVSMSGGIAASEQSIVRPKITALMDSVKKTISAYSKDFSIIGKNLMIGLANGISENSLLVKQQVNNVAATALTALRSKLKINSPSKETGLYGRYFVEGFVDNIRSSLGSVRTSVESMGATALSMMNKIFTNVDGMDMAPVITPVINFDEIQNGTKTINSMMERQYAYALDVSSGLDKISSIAFQMESNSERDTQIITELQNLRTDMSDLSSAVQNMKIVMDSGQLVGSIATKMDKALGANMTRSKRGI